jgi:predicted TPR repeat methyltransferase
MSEQADTPGSEAQQRLREAIAKHRAGDHLGAETAYLEHLRQFPHDASGRHFLGLLRNHQNRNVEAIALITAALEADPGYVDAWSNLAIAYLEEHDIENAERCCRRAIELKPDFVNAWTNLGIALCARNAPEEALGAWARVLELAPDMRGVAIRYGQLLYRLDRTAEALDFYRQWLAKHPDDPVPRHMLAAVGGAERPARASNAFVRETFDGFAESFDRSLQRLQYRAPQLLFEAVAGFRAPSRTEGLEVLDIGCGTGLCGPMLRPLARRLVGVDLSPLMLSKAAARGVYDQLNCAELTEWLAGCGQQFDLAVAADVLCYFGDLSTVFERVREVLRPGGCFACSLEAMPEGAGSERYILAPHGRYQHGRGHVEAALGRAGLAGVRLSEEILRYERQEAVVGHVVLARHEA